MRLLWSVALVACATKSAEPKSRTPEARAARMRHYAPQRGPIDTTARELFDDFTRPSADGLELLDKYREGARFTATVRTVGVDEAGNWVVWVDIDGENVMTLDFAEPPTNVKVGGELTVTCKIGGASGALMMVTGCMAASS